MPTYRLYSPTSPENQKIPQKHVFAIRKSLPSSIDNPIYSTFAGKKYKPVNRKIRPVPATFPEDAYVVRQFPEDPLLSLPSLSTHPPEFTPTPKITRERLDILKINSDDFLWPEEEKLLTMAFTNNEKALAFDESERGTLRSDYFTDYIIPVVEHVPWANRQIPIPPGLLPKVIDSLK
jgi:hypothetical protein